MGDTMAYNNPILEFSDKHPVIAFFVVPVAMQLAASGVFYVIRAAKTGSPLGSGVGAGEEENPDPLVALGNVRKQGGEDLDLAFRATSNARPAGYGTGLWDTVMPSPTSQPVRYDGKYHDELWISDPANVTRKRVVDQSRVYKEDVSVFNGINGLHKLR